MKIHEVSQITEIPKRTIQFYMKEQLIQPRVNPANGYYDFTQDDCARLLLIRDLRRAEFPISSIRSMLNAPSSSVYYLNLQIHRLNSQIRRTSSILESLRYMQRNLPLQPDVPALYQLAEHADIPAPTNSTNPAIDSEDKNAADDVVCRFLWESFLPEDSLSDYQEFLWSKILKATRQDNRADYQLLSSFLRSLTDPQIENLFYNAHEEHRTIAELSETACLQFAEKTKSQIRSFLNNPRQLQLWKKSYHSFYAPNTRLCDSSVNAIMMELSPFFAAYYRNVHRICSTVYDWLHSEEGAKTLARMNTVLGEYCDIDHHSHGELIAMLFVREGI